MKYVLYISLVFIMFSCKNIGSIDKKETLSYSVSEKVNSSIIEKVCSDSINGAQIFVYNTKFNFGKVKQNKVDSIKINFEIKNIGNKPLIIYKCDVSCGVCFTVDYSKEPILPNNKSTITANIETKNQEGPFNKTIFIKSNAKEDVVLLRIIGEIE